MFLLIAGELYLAGKNSSHLLSTPSHKSSIGNQTNILFEIRHSSLDDLGYQPITILRKLWTDIETILMDYH